MKGKGKGKEKGRSPRAVSRGGTGPADRPRPSASDTLAATSATPGGGRGCAELYTFEGPRAEHTSQREAVQRETSAEVREKACQCAASITTSYEARRGSRQGRRLSKRTTVRFGKPSAARA